MEYKLLKTLPTMKGNSSSANRQISDTQWSAGRRKKKEPAMLTRSPQWPCRVLSLKAAEPSPGWDHRCAASPGTHPAAHGHANHPQLSLDASNEQKAAAKFSKQNVNGRQKPPPTTSAIFFARAWPPKQLNLARIKQSHRWEQNSTGQSCQGQVE